MVAHLDALALVVLDSNHFQVQVIDIGHPPRADKNRINRNALGLAVAFDVDHLVSANRFDTGDVAAENEVNAVSAQRLFDPLGRFAILFGQDLRVIA